MFAALAARHWGAVLALVLALFGGAQTWRIGRLHSDLADRDRAVGAAQAERSAAEAALHARDAAAMEKGATDKGDARELASAMRGTCAAAFDAGYAARKCNVAEAENTHELRDLWRAGAFTGSEDRPGRRAD